MFMKYTSPGHSLYPKLNWDLLSTKGRHKVVELNRFCEFADIIWYVLLEKTFKAPSIAHVQLVSSFYACFMVYIKKFYEPICSS